MNECDGAGNIVAVLDDTDVPDDNNPCTNDLCAGGAPAHFPAAPGTVCGPALVCGVSGQCVQCNSPVDCAGTDTECHTRTCFSGICGVSFAPAGTLTSSQVQGDCLQNQCDGSGNVVTSVLVVDVPGDGNACTTGICLGDLPLTLPASAGTACNQNGGNVCSADGACVRSFDVVRVGDGSASLTNAASPVFLEERFVSDGTLVPKASPNPLALPTAPNGSNAQLTISGTAVSEGGLARSADGHYLTLTGYGAPLGTASVATTASSSVNRIVGRVDASGGVDTSTRINAFLSGTNIRNAVTDDGTQLWVAGALGGIIQIPFGTTGGTSILGSPGNVRVVNIFAGQLYGSTGTAGFSGVFAAGSGIPATPGQAATALPGMPLSGSSPYAYVFFDLNPSVPGVDVLYVADDRSAPSGGIQRWVFDGSTWTLGATLNQVSTGALTASMSFRGVTGYVTGNSVTLIASSSAASANALAVFVDDGVSTPVGTVIASAPMFTVYRGVALPPQ
jgi:hypothetical protein